MAAQVHSRSFFLFLTVLSVLGAFSCSVPLGPGYIVEKQQIRVRFSPSPAPRLRIEADYQLKNTGNCPLSSLEVRLPGERQFHLAAVSANWDGAAIPLEVAADHLRNSVLNFPQPWTISARRSLHLVLEIQPPAPGESGFSFAADAFFLPSEDWNPELPPERGLFGFGGVPPDKWDLIVEVPGDFQVHTSGGSAKSSRKLGQLTVSAVQQKADKYPFVVAGHYASSRIAAGAEEVFLWTRAPAAQDHLREASNSLVDALQAYDSVFGRREKKHQPLWVVECPVASACLAKSPSAFAQFLTGDAESHTAEMVSLDTVLIDVSASSPNLGAVAAPALAAAWLGYGQNPGFYEQQPPLHALPAYAAALGRAAVEGPGQRAEIIRRALLAVPENAAASRAPEDSAVLRAKSLLFFYGLEDRYGQLAFRNAMTHMLGARRSRGFNLNDLIAAFEHETHQNVAEFVRRWMKQPGVPTEFRNRHQNVSAQSFDSPQEKTP